MKKIRKVTTTFILLLSLLMAFSCVAQAKTYTKKIKPYEGAVWTIKYKGLVNKKAKWTVDNSKVATVNKNGKVTVKQAGKATVTAKYKKNTYKFVINATKERKINSKIGKVKGVTVSVVSMTKDWIKIKYTNTTKKFKSSCEAYIKLGKKVYYIENIMQTAIASKSSRTITLRSGRDFSGKLDVNAERFEIAWWFLE